MKVYIVISHDYSSCEEPWEAPISNVVECFSSYEAAEQSVATFEKYSFIEYEILEMDIKN